jgi:MOSC domain-containing protein YiiM
MKLVSLNTGLPREVTWHGRSVTTLQVCRYRVVSVCASSIWTATARQTPTVHGGAYKAVYCYPTAYHDYWKRELPGRELPTAIFGENFTTENRLEDSVHLATSFLSVLRK